MILEPVLITDRYKKYPYLISIYNIYLLSVVSFMCKYDFFFIFLLMYKTHKIYIEPSKWVRTRGSIQSTTGLGWKFFTNVSTGQFFIRSTKNPIHPGWTHGEPGWPTNSYGHTHYVGFAILGMFF